MGKGGGSSKSAQRTAASAAQQQAVTAQQLLEQSREQQQYARQRTAEFDPIALRGFRDPLAQMLGVPLGDQGSAAGVGQINPKTGLPFPLYGGAGGVATTAPTLTRPLPESETGILFQRAPSAEVIPGITLPGPIDAPAWAGVGAYDLVGAYDPIAALNVPSFEAVSRIDPVPEIDPVTRQNITENPLYAAGKSQLEREYARRRESVFEDVPGRYSGLLAERLGGMTRDLTAAESGLFADLGMLERGLREDRRQQELQERLGVRAEEVFGRERERQDILAARGVERAERVRQAEGMRAEEVRLREQMRGEEVIGTERDRLANIARLESARLEKIRRDEQMRLERVRTAEREAIQEQARREGFLNLAASLTAGREISGLEGAKIAAGMSATGAQTLGQAGYQQQLLAQTLTTQQSEKKGGLGELVGTIGGAYAGKTCHTARLVFGETNINWLRFYDWKESCAPEWFRKFYNRHTERFAGWLRAKPLLQKLVRALMLKVVREK